MQPFILLAADFGTVIAIFFGIVVPLILYIAQAIAGVKNNKNPGGGGQPGQGQPKPQQANALSDEIDKFLSRMTQQGDEEEVVDVQVLEPHEVERVPEQPHRLVPAAAEIVPVEEPGRHYSNISDNVATHVQEHIESSSFEKQVSRLGAVPDHADERIEQRLHQKFDHQVGHISSDSVFGDGASNDLGAAPSPYQDNTIPNAISPGEISPISSIADIFASPEGIRRAIIMNEILRRPEEKW